MSDARLFGTTHRYERRNVIELGLDVASSASTAFQNITELAFPVTAAINYRYLAYIMYTTSANTIGMRVSYTSPAVTHAAYTTMVPPGSTTGGVPAAGTDNTWVNWQNVADTGTVSGASMSTTAGNLLILMGIIRPSANGTFQLRFAPETATANGVIIEAGSTLEWW